MIILLGCSVVTAVSIADVFCCCDLRVAGSMFMIVSALQLDILWLSCHPLIPHFNIQESVTDLRHGMVRIAIGFGCSNEQLQDNQFVMT